MLFFHFNNHYSLVVNHKFIFKLTQVQENGFKRYNTMKAGVIGRFNPSYQKTVVKYGKIVWKNGDCFAAKKRCS